MANLIIDIGNTALKASWADGITLGKTFRYQGERMLDFIISLTSRSKPDIMVLSSVRTFSQQAVERLRNECGRLVIINEEMLAEYLPQGEFDERLFEGIVEKIMVDDNTKITFKLIGGVELTEKIIEKGRCKSL